MEYTEMLSTAWNGGKRHIIVTGESGTGKTAFLQRIARDLQVCVPIYVNLSTAHGNNLIISKILKEYCGELEATDSELALTEKLLQILNTPCEARPSYILLLDGIDEIADSIRGNISREIKQLSVCAGVQLVIAVCSSKYMRDNFYFDGLDNFLEYKMMPIPEDKVRAQLQKKNVSFDDLPNSVRELLNRPLFLTVVLELADAGHDFHEISGTYDLYKKVIDLKVERVGKQDGKLGTAAYALNIFLPALASKLDAPSFSFDDVKEKLVQTFLDTSYANPGLDGISTDLIARLNKSTDSGQRRFAMEAVVSELCKLYLDNIAVSQNFLIKTEDRYRFSHKSWFQYFQLTHIINEVRKDGTDRIPVSVENLADRYFDTKNAGNIVSTEKLEPLMNAAFERVLEENDGKKKKKRITFKFILPYILGLAAVICIVIFILIQQHSTPMYNFELTPTEMTVSEFKESAEMIRRRAEMLSGNRKIKFKVQDNTIYLSIPQEVFYQTDPVSTVKKYVSREQRFYLVDVSSTDWLNLDLRSLQIHNYDIEDIDIRHGVIPGTNSEDSRPDPEGHEFIAIHMQPEWSVENQNTIEAWQDVRLATDIGYDSWEYTEKIVLSDDYSVIYIPLNENVPENFVRTLVFNIENKPLAGAFGVAFELDIVWESPKNAVRSGKNQVREKALKDDTITIYYSTSVDDLATGTWIDLLATLKERMDALGEPYAIGYQYHDEGYQILIKTVPDHLNQEIIRFLTVKYPNMAFSITSGLHRYNNYRNLFGEIAKTDSGEIRFSVGSEVFSGYKSLAEFIRECSDASREEFRLCVNNVPLLTASINSVTTDEIVFCNLAWNDEKLSEDSVWLLDFILTLMNGPELPDYISLYGVTTDAEGDIRIEDRFQLNNDDLLRSYSEIISSVDPELASGGVNGQDQSTYNVFLNLPVNEELAEIAVYEIKKIYQGIDFEKSRYGTLIFFLGDEKHEQQERSRVWFDKDYSLHEIKMFVLFKNGRYDKYLERLSELICTDTFFEQFEGPYINELS